MTLRLLPLLMLATACIPTQGGTHGSYGSPAPAVQSSATGTGTSAGTAPDAKTGDQTSVFTVGTNADRHPQAVQVTATATAVTTSAAGPCYKLDPAICQLALQVFQLVNQERAHPTRDRADHGGPQAAMPPLRFGPKWSFVAEGWSQAQAQRGDIGHDGFPDVRVSVFAKEFQVVNSSLVGENVAMASSSPDTVAQQFFTMWKNSDGHYRNMLIDAPVMGVGLAQDGRGNWYGTQIFGDE